MNKNSSKYPIDEPSEIIRYVQNGYHAFVGCDRASERESFVEAIQVALDGEIQTFIPCGVVEDRREFVTQIVVACQGFVLALGQPMLERTPSLASSLEETMALYRKQDRQGFLILGDMDRVIEMQRTMEIEGSLRSVMQIYDNIAVVIIASNDTINDLVGDYNRPFYMSFRVFRL